MTQQRFLRINEIALLIALLFAVAIPGQFMLAPVPRGHLTTLRGVICTPGRGQFEVMPLDFVGPPSPFPWPPDFIRCPATPELPEPPFDEPPTPAGGPAFEPFDYLQEIGPYVLLRVPEAAELQPNPIAGAVETSK